MTQNSMRMSMMQSRIPFGGITDYEGAKEIARKLFDLYDTDRDGILSYSEIPAMMVDAYRAMNKGFNPSQGDKESYHRLLDRDGDGRITLRDLEELAVRYLVGENNVKRSTTEVVKRNVYSSEVESRLELARRLFRRIDKDSSGFITEDEVPDLIFETYKQMGLSKVPTYEDVKIWMHMTDTNKDGKVSLSEYEDLVIRSLKNVGIKIE